ncbi:hypothetical protein RISK_006658 [Rhodopirellula islandica]|uniref:Uncharacterized protein n=1 Tax=Rhodopirellula islandica TaxID=595434 RepID=A0A0J1B424_RHOIS|nr:hypothetical protein RISK_006658 [Rhodopirellula islandica]
MTRPARGWVGPWMRSPGEWFHSSPLRIPRLRCNRHVCFIRVS